MTGASPRRYDRVAMLLHWAIAFALLAQVAFGFALDTLAPRGTAERGEIVNLHKSTGLVLGALIVLRLAWRWRHAPPAWPPSMPALQRRAATLGHRALYACMLVMPLSGYVASNFSRHGVRFFGEALAPWGPDLPAVYALFNGLHVVSAYALVALVAGHVAVAAWHAVRRDGVFARMWPQRAPPRAAAPAFDAAARAR